MEVFDIQSLRVCVCARLMFLNSRTLCRMLMQKVCKTFLQEYNDKTLIYIVQTVQKFAQ